MKRVLMRIEQVALLLIRGLQLFFILPICACSQKAFMHFWNKYYTHTLQPNLFNLCVQWLLYTGKRMNLSYERINILIFCIIWPAITILSVCLNIALIFSVFFN